MKHQRVIMLPDWANIELEVIEDLQEQKFRVEFNKKGYEMNFVISVDYHTQPINEEITTTIFSMIANQLRAKELKKNVRSNA